MKGVALGLAVLALAGTAWADDKEYPAPVNWWIYSGQTIADIGATLKELPNVRVSDMQVTGRSNFTVIYVQNTGSYGKQWWWYPQTDDAALGKLLTANNGRLICLRAYDFGGGAIRYAAVMISNTGVDGKSWWWGADLTLADIRDLVQKRNARLTSLQSYETKGSTRYAVTMIANTGADSRAWWWYPNASPQSIGQALTSNKAHLLDLTPAGNGNFNAVMEQCAGQCPSQQWYFGQSGDRIMSLAQRNNARIVTAGSYPGCGGYCYAAVMLQGSSAGLEHGTLVDWSKGSKPFDLVWPTNANGRLLAHSGVDRNRIPFNPRWFSQIADVSFRPDFPGTCFSKPAPSNIPVVFGTGNANLPFTVFDASLCTNQHLWPDLFVPTGPGESIASGVGGLCQGLISGHVNWRPATYTGTLYFDDWSKADLSNADLQDDDYNFSLLHSDHSGLTATEVGSENQAPDPALLLEFNSDETTPRFGSPWWKQYRYDVESAPRREGAAWAVDGSPAMVTGLLGLDGVHSGYTELHPVYSMAIHLTKDDKQAGKDANGNYHVVEHWAFFLRNYGNEGNCSSLGHHWPAPFKDSSGRGVYYIQLPWPQTDGGPATTAGASVAPSKGTFVWGWEHGTSYQLGYDPGYWTYVELHLPNSDNGEEGADGDLYLEYTLGRVPANPVVTPQERTARGEPPRDTEIDWNEVQKHVTDPGAREQLLRALRSAKPAPATSDGEPMVADPKVVVYNPEPSPAQLTEDRAAIDPIKTKRAADMKAALQGRH
jgi:hypothetical protein